jgi:hypothetical protein
MSSTSFFAVLLLVSAAVAVIPPGMGDKFTSEPSKETRTNFPTDLLKVRPYVLAKTTSKFQTLDNDHGHDNCVDAGLPHGFPFCPTTPGACPDFGASVSWRDDSDEYRRMGEMLGLPPVAHPEAIYSTWPQPFLRCYEAYCVPENVDPICHYISAARGARSKIQIAVVHQLYQNVVCNSPTDCTPWNILTSNLTIPGNVLSPSVQMRINPLGFFPTFPVVAGYFYALGQPPPNTNVTGKSRVSKIFFTSPEVAYGNKVCGHVDIFSSAFFSDNTVGKNFTHYYCFAFDANNQISYGEISFRHLGTLSDVPDCVPGLNVVIANSLCPGIQFNCVGANQQYASVADCVAYVGSLPTATWDKANQANIPCVSLHLLLTFMFPDIHCPHVGPTGGGFCTNAHVYTWDFTAVPSDLMVFADPNY